MNYEFFYAFLALFSKTIYDTYAFKKQSATWFYTEQEVFDMYKGNLKMKYQYSLYISYKK